MGVYRLFHFRFEVFFNKMGFSCWESWDAGLWLFR
ncbi:hypothetical protein SLEP1_g50755 [Rubroshorea leprosula]|uniref:Uncharacterized protein n=1 Tax=Rubroshorea leprosula TaxID=152421 RepID=A0AAV5M142_9ROSI|nr:hypothetical protein SLEP1_g50755 [Rubroshorea leprosula]